MRWIGRAGLGALAVLASSAIVFLLPRYPNIDALLHYRWLDQFIMALQAGFVPPRWAMVDVGGIGAPVFLYYPSAFYLLATPLALAMEDRWLAIRLVGVLIGLALVATVALGLRRDERPAWLLGLAVLLSPGVFFVQGFLHAYPWYLSLVPTFALMQQTIRQATRGEAFRPSVPILYALVCVTHPLSGMMVALVLPSVWLRRLVVGHFRAEVLVPAIGWALAMVLGAALAGFYLVPALGLLGLVNPGGWSNAGGLGWHDSFLMPFLVHPYWRRVLFVLAPATYLLALLAGYALWREGVRGDPAREAAADWLSVALPCLLLACQLSYPLWATVTPLHILQRPFRFFPIASMATLAAAWHVWPFVAGGLRAAIGGAIALLLASTAVLQAVQIGFSEVVVSPARLNEFYGAPEYLPRNRGETWRAYVDQGGLAAACTAQRVDCAERAEGGRMLWEVRAPAPAELRLPLFAFPAWALRVNGAPHPLVACGDGGLVCVALSPGENRIEARWVALPAERTGLLVSAAVVPPWALATLLLRRRRDRAAGC